MTIPLTTFLREIILLGLVAGEQLFIICLEKWILYSKQLFFFSCRQQLFQNAKCDAPKNNLFGCHSMWRSVCEINYRCGTNGRPVVCKCISQFGYPVPVQNGTRTFEEACEDAQDDWDAMMN